MYNYENKVRRSVRYYQIIQEHKNSGKQNMSLPHWKEVFSLFFDGHGNTVHIDEFTYQLHDNVDGLVVITMHKKIDLTFATKEDESNGNFTDVDPGEQEVQRFAHASVAVVGELEDKLYVAITKGGHSGSPAKTAFTAILTEAVPVQDGWSWRVDGVMNESDYEKLKASNGITMIEGSFVAHASEGEIEGLGYASPMENLAKHIADYVSTNVRVKVTIDLLDYSNENTAKARDLAIKTPFETTKGRKPKVKAQMMNGEELLTLAQHNFSSEIYLDINDIIGVKFSALINRSIEDFHLNAQKLLQS
jgi:hypothetical protein